ncbi:MAG: ribosomal protein S5-alanine N-acetyltransferase [Nostocaceae cyanobacterium]|nr:ribosomal protein S5-alanine N-acetyltransferase [Nostocaceae cyanobacterium]
MKSALPIIETKRLILRLGKQKDIPQIIQYFTQNKEYLTPFYPRWQDAFFTEEYWWYQVQQNTTEFYNDLSCRLFIFLKSNPDLIIGVVNFSNFLRGAAQYCTLGYSLAEAEQGKGYMIEALQAAINYVFTDLNLHRIMANYMPHNQRSGNLLKRLGFVVEGYARDYLLINDMWEDHILTSLINSDWTG